MRRYILFALFLCLHWVAWGQSGYEYRYWFDGDETSQQTGSSASAEWHIDADMSGLTCSMHSIHLQVKDAGGQWSAPVTRYFVKSTTADIPVFYWFDGNAGKRSQLADGDGPVMIDVSELGDGFHVAYFQVAGRKDTSMPQSGMFIKVPQTAGVSYLTCLCSIDGKTYRQERVPSSGGIVRWGLDVAELPYGIHRISVQVVTPSGAATNVSEQFFFRSTTASEFANMKLLYTVDGDNFYSEAGRFADGLYHFDVDVASLEDGLHRLTYMLTSETGTSTKVSTAFFMKTPVGGPGITHYRYWLNNREDAAHQTKLEKRADPFSLITLLPVETCGIRSSCFQFEIEDGSPVIYAKNDLHMQFTDVSGRMAEMSRQYVDYSVAEPVTDIAELVPDVRKTSSKPADNGINWYAMKVITGDSLAFKTDQACTLQLFSPSGKEVYSASGPSSVAFGGCHAYEDGTYYLALHDVKGTNGSNISVDYQHIDKYAVLEYTPDEIGVFGESIVDMSFFGNGYEKLVKAYLHSEKCDIVPDTIMVKAKSEMTLRFFIYGEEELGDYDIVLQFEDEGKKDTLVIDNGLSLVKGVWEEPEVKISYLRSLARPYPVKISVTNKSNVGLIYLPINIAYDNIDIIENVNFDNFYVPMDSISYKEGYMPFVVTDNFVGKGQTAAVLNLFIPQIGPNETIEYTLGFTAPSHTKFNLYAWTGKALNHPDETPDTLTNIPSIYGYYDQLGYGQSDVTPLKAMQRACIRDLRRPIDAASTVANNAIATGHLIGGIANGAAHYGDMARLEAYGIDPSSELYKDISGLHRMETPEEIFDDPASASHWLAHLWQRRHRNAQDDNPQPDPNPIEILNPGDPNDIFGYVAESGSKFIKDALVDVSYTIEFENDPEIATAAAHTIIVTDTIDASVHDLATFMPKSIKIGHVQTEFDGDVNFVKTIDLRPSINVIAQVKVDYNQTKGIVKLLIESLDPMTMEPTVDAMDGVLPVNADGNGQGEFVYDIKLRKGLTCGTEINNRAAIIFDDEGVIMTPVWTNIIDDVSPNSSISKCTVKNDNILELHFSGEDNLSGIWKYDLYMQEEVNGEWTKIAENLTDSLYEYKGCADVNYGFCILATDSAGNVEKKELAREINIVAYKVGDANGDGLVNVLDASLATSKYLGDSVQLNILAADVNSDGIINSVDVALIQEKYLAETNKRILIKRTRLKKKNNENN